MPNIEKEVIDAFPEAANIAELAQHHPEGTPIYRICEYLFQLTHKLLCENASEVTSNEDG